MTREAVSRSSGGRKGREKVAESILIRAFQERDAVWDSQRFMI